MPFSVMKSSLWVNVKAKQIPSAFFHFLNFGQIKVVCYYYFANFGQVMHLIIWGNSALCFFNLALSFDLDEIYSLSEE